MILLDNNLLHKARRKTRREVKHLRLRVRPAQRAAHPLLHVLGCQRSGTTMLTDLLDRDPHVRVHGELEGLFDDVPRHHRMKDLDEVLRLLQRGGARLDVVKPLVESHRSSELLGLDDRAVAVWMFRHYTGVAVSNIRRFGVDNGHSNLRAIVDDDPTDWRNAGITSDLRESVRSLYAEELTAHDAAALFWYCRNSLFFQQRLAADERVRTCQYEQLVTDPQAVLVALYTWLGLGTVPADVVRMVHDRSVGRGRDLDFHPAVEALCDEMWEQLLLVDRINALIAEVHR